jgi:hypothetical protein
MKRDLFAISGGILGVGFLAWAFWGSPEALHVYRTRTVQILDDDPDLKLVSAHSSYMRNER